MPDIDVMATEELVIAADQDVVRVRQAVRTLAVTLKLSLVDQTKVVTAASELARNTLIYGGGGSVVVDTITDSQRKGVRLTFADQGPGIANLEQALVDGFTTGSGLGLGLSGSRRLMDQFEIDSGPGRGTTIIVTKWAR